MTPEVTTQPPAPRINVCTNEKYMPCTHWCVCVNAGQFDVPIFETGWKTAAEIYYLQVLPLSESIIELKPRDEVRELQETFRQESILVSLSV